MSLIPLILGEQAIITPVWHPDLACRYRLEATVFHLSITQTNRMQTAIPIRGAGTRMRSVFAQNARASTSTAVPRRRRRPQADSTDVDLVAPSVLNPLTTITSSYSSDPTPHPISVPSSTPPLPPADKPPTHPTRPASSLTLTRKLRSKISSSNGDSAENAST